MTLPLATISTYAELMAAFRARADEIEFPRLGLDAIAGLSDGHASKLLCGTKSFGKVSLFAMLDALGLDLMLVENPTKRAAAAEAARRLGVGKRWPTMNRSRNARKALAGLVGPLPAQPDTNATAVGIDELNACLLERPLDCELRAV